jgi:hypothetical protein
MDPDGEDLSIGKLTGAGGFDEELAKALGEDGTGIWAFGKVF